MTTRPLPARDQAGAFFWTAGAHEELRVAWCTACSLHLHPSNEICPHCLHAELTSIAVNGDAKVVAFTDNHQQWLPNLPPPYVIAIVQLDAAPTIRLTTNIVDCAPAEVRVGLPVQVKFEQHGEVWLPMFAPRTVELVSFEFDSPPKIRNVMRAVRDCFEEKVAFTGIGASRIARQVEGTPLQWMVAASRAAVKDAGLTFADIDGLNVYPSSSGLPGVSDGGVRALEAALNIQPTWHCGAHEVSGQLGGVIQAMLAVSAGICRHALCVTSFSQKVRPGANRILTGASVSGELAWQVPFGAASPANWIALYASHYLAKYKVSRETLAWIALTARKHAARNPDAVYRDFISMDDYLSARMISSPFGLFDCDVPCDGAMAVVVSRVEAARDLAQPVVRVAAVGTQMSEVQAWDQGSLAYQKNIYAPARHVWSRTDLTQADVDVALLYDGFTFNAISWLEALGFCGEGEAASIVEGGTRIDLGGELPLNPHGGQLSAGRTNGFGHLVEAIVQLRGHAAARQVTGAKVAAISAGGGIPAGCMLLTNQRL